MLAELVRVARLYDIYGQLLTPKQRYWVELRYHHDLSLGEIAEEEGVSRQAIHDSLQRAIRALERYESRIGCLKRELDLQEKLRAALGHLERYFAQGEVAELKALEAILVSLLEPCLPLGEKGAKAGAFPFKREDPGDI